MVRENLTIRNFPVARPLAFTMNFGSQQLVGNGWVGRCAYQKVKVTNANRIRLSEASYRRNRSLTLQPQMARRRLDGQGREYITLESFMKLKGICQTGGGAKAFLIDGHVTVNGDAEARRGRKLHAGDRVIVRNQCDLVVAFDEKA